MVLGKTDAAVALPLGDATVDGPIAALLRRAAYLYRMPTDAHRAKLAGSWLEQSAKFAAEEDRRHFTKTRRPAAARD